MTATSRPIQKFRLTASNIAKYFANRCDRNFRWNTVAGPLRGKSGIGWNVPQKVRAHSRPVSRKRKQTSCSNFCAH